MALAQELIKKQDLEGSVHWRLSTSLKLIWKWWRIKISV